MAGDGWSLSHPACVEIDELLVLYESVGWSAYAADPDQLARAIRGSSWSVAARSEPSELVALARAVSDDASICYLQDVLVRPSWQRKGVGRALVEAVGDRYAHVRQMVLLTDDEPRQRAFYEALGSAEARDFEQGTLRAFVRFKN